MHPIRVYLQDAGLSRAEFVEKLRAAGSLTMSVPYLNQIVIGHRYPSRELALLMESVSDGKVSLDALLRWSPPVEEPAAPADENGGEAA